MAVGGAQNVLGSSGRSRCDGGGRGPGPGMTAPARGAGGVAHARRSRRRRSAPSSAAPSPTPTTPRPSRAGFWRGANAGAGPHQPPALGAERNTPRSPAQTGHGGGVPGPRGRACARCPRRERAPALAITPLAGVPPRPRHRGASAAPAAPAPAAPPTQAPARRPQRQRRFQRPFTPPRPPSHPAAPSRGDQADAARAGLARPAPRPASPHGVFARLHSGPGGSGGAAPRRAARHGHRWCAPGAAPRASGGLVRGPNRAVGAGVAVAAVGTALRPRRARHVCRARRAHRAPPGRRPSARGGPPPRARRPAPARAPPQPPHGPRAPGARPPPRGAAGARRAGRLPAPRLAAARRPLIAQAPNLPRAPHAPPQSSRRRRRPAARRPTSTRWPPP
jgi:hypothetical protein